MEKECALARDGSLEQGGERVAVQDNILQF